MSEVRTYSVSEIEKLQEIETWSLEIAIPKLNSQEAEIERLREELKDCRDEYADEKREWNHYVARLREALEFYANRKHYRWASEDDSSTMVGIDHGDRARAALKEQSE